MTAPIHVQFELTEKCNHRCLYCYNYFRDNPSANEANVGAIAEKMAEKDIFSVTITGGEPLLVKKDLYKAISVFDKNNMEYSINTNLTLASDEDFERMRSSRGFRSILTSMGSYSKAINDEMTQIDGSFDKLIESIKNAKKRGITPSINMVLTQKNKGQVYETGKFAHECLGIKNFYATPISPSPNRNHRDLSVSAEECIEGLDDLLKLKEDFSMQVDALSPVIPCMFEEGAIDKYKHFFKRACSIHSGAAISSKGQIRPCTHSDKILGNILNEKLEDILDKPRKESSLIPRECGSCSCVTWCRGGCRTAAQSFSGNLNGKPPYFKGPVQKAISRGDRKNIKIEDKSRIFVPKNIKYRKDGNKTTVYASLKSFASLDEDHFNLFKYLASNSGKEIGFLKKELKMAHQMDSSLNHLWNKGLIILK